MVDLGLPTNPALRRLRRAEWDVLVERGAFAGEKVELIRGWIVKMSPQGFRHAKVVRKLIDALVPRLRERATLLFQMPFVAVDESEPEPDCVIAPPGSAETGHPSRALLVIEVSDSSAGYDLGEKRSLYAQSDVDEYWVIDLTTDRVIVHRERHGGRFAVVSALGRGERLAPVAFPDVELMVDEIL